MVTLLEWGTNERKQVYDARSERRKRRGKPRKEWEQYISIGEIARDRRMEFKTLKTQDRDAVRKQGKKRGGRRKRVV